MEVLGVIVIMGMLAAIALGAMHKVREEAKRTKTVATVTKISRVIMAKYESYRTRRVPCDVGAVARAVYASAPQPPTPEQIARARLNALHELMRLEMPDRLSDVTRVPATFQVNDMAVMFQPAAGSYFLKMLPSATRRYQASLAVAYQACNSSQETMASFSDAKLLYLIVANDPEALAQFREDEIDRPDKSGLAVFVDGWKRPIRFIRWPAGFLPEAASDPGTLLETTLLGDSEIQTRAKDNEGKYYVNPDPFDPMLIAKRYYISGNVLDAGYAIYPLVYSAGPDGYYDINIGKNPSGATTAYALVQGSDGRKDLNPYIPDGNGLLVGTPRNDESSGGNVYTPRHYDNIHNHRSEMR